jgi:CheY-like chemotaxis protein
MEPVNNTTDPIYTALVVDDNFYNRQIFHIALESVGYTVSESEDGVQGTALLDTRTFHVLILDLQMPTLDGRAVLQIVKANPLHKNMRIIVVTANAHMATDDIDHMADYIMHKPIDVVEFSEFVSRLKRTPVTPARQD